MVAAAKRKAVNNTLQKPGKKVKISLITEKRSSNNAHSPILDARLRKSNPSPR
jgi:hypothetical protein